MTFQEMTDYCDSQTIHQEEIISDSWKYWNMELDEMIDKL
jgi:hypothetical protein